MIPEFDQYTGYLPPGVHKAQWAEVVQRFGTNEHRCRLLVGLENALVNLAQAGCKVVLLNGSFIIDKDKPKDYDGAWEHYGVDLKLLDPVFLDDSDSFKAMKDKYKGELYPAFGKARLSTGEGRKVILFRDFFQIDREKRPKGIIKLDPRELL